MSQTGLAQRNPSCVTPFFAHRKNGPKTTARMIGVLLACMICTFTILPYLLPRDSYHDSTQNQNRINQLQHFKSEGRNELSDSSSNFHKEESRTGSFANCKPPPISDEEKMKIKPSEDGNYFHGTAVISCESFQYKVPSDVFRGMTPPGIVVGVLSGSKNVQRREVIRSTWAHNEKGVVFVVAGSWDDIKDEFASHGDLVWIDQKEHFHSITRKTAIILVAVDQIMAHFKMNYSHIIKTDDDSYVDLDGWRDFVVRHGSKQLDYAGKFQAGPSPIRDPENKYYTSVEEYPEPFFPAYCQGLGFLMSHGFVQCATSSGHIANVRYLKHEDVYVGMLVERCGLSNGITSIKEHVLRPFRTGLAQDAQKERDAIYNRIGRIEKKDLPKAEMVGKLVQHHIHSDADMIDHHTSYLNSRDIIIRSLDEIHVNDQLEFYFDDHWCWLECVVMGILRGKNILLRFPADGYVQSYNFEQNRGLLRKPSGLLSK